MHKVVLSVIVALVVVGGAGFFLFRDIGTIEPIGAGTLPATVAVINGETVSGAEFETFEQQLAAGQGFSLEVLDAETRGLIRQQVLEAMVSQTLVRQAAERASVSVDDATIDAELVAIRDQFEDEASFESALAEEGLTAETLRDRVATNLLTQAFLEQELQLSAMTVTDAEVAAAYQDAIAGVGAEIAPALEEIRDQIEMFALQRKQQAAIEAFVTQLRADAEVEILI